MCPEKRETTPDKFWGKKKAQMLYKEIYMEYH